MALSTPSLWRHADRPHLRRWPAVSMRGASTPSSTHPSSKVKAITVNDIINMMILLTPKPILWKWWLIKMFRSMEATYTEVTREVRARDILLYLHHDDDHKNDHYHDYISRITMMIILGIEMMITLVLTTRWPPPPCPTWKRWSRSLSNEPRIFARNRLRPGVLLVDGDDDDDDDGGDDDGTNPDQVIF